MRGSVGRALGWVWWCTSLLRERTTCSQRDGCVVKFTCMSVLQLGFRTRNPTQTAHLGQHGLVHGSCTAYLSSHSSHLYRIKDNLRFPLPFLFSTTHSLSNLPSQLFSAHHQLVLGGGWGTPPILTPPRHFSTSIPTKFSLSPPLSLSHTPSLSFSPSLSVSLCLPPSLSVSPSPQSSQHQRTSEQRAMRRKWSGFARLIYCLKVPRIRVCNISSFKVPHLSVCLIHCLNLRPSTYQSRAGHWAG